MANDEINVPSLVLILVVSGFLLRHFFFRGTGDAAGAASASAGHPARRPSTQDPRRVDALERRTEAAVEQIQQIFPHADRREIWWDLRRNNVNVAATTERLLSGRLETPPVTFQPPAPRSSAPNSASSVAAAAASAASRSGQPSLIQRYNLQGRLAATGAAAPSDTPSTPGTSTPPGAAKPAKSWSSNKDERQALLKKRRDDMILEARRKMEAKLAAEKAAASSSA